MELSDKDKQEIAEWCVSILDSTFFKEEKDTFYSFLSLEKTTSVDFFIKSLSTIYEKNNIVEFNILEINSNVDSEIKYSEAESQIIYDFFLLTPRVIPIWAEVLRQNGSLGNYYSIH